MKKAPKLFWKYVLPSIIGMLICGSYSIVDTVFIGLSGGKNALAAASITWPVIMLLQAFGSLVGSGGAVLISQSAGAGNMKRTQRLFDQVLLLAACSGIVLTLTTFPFLEKILLALDATPEIIPVSLRYAQCIVGGLLLNIFMTMLLEIIRNDGHPTLSMAIMVCGLAVNIVLDWIFVFALKQGVVGAAIATVISMGLACIAELFYFISPLTKLHFTQGMFRPHWQEIKEIIITGIPIFGNMLSIIVMLYMHNAQSLRYGGVDGLAAYTVISALESLGSLLMTGIACGIQPLTAQMYGAEKFKRQNRFGNMGYTLAFVLGIILMLFSFAVHEVMPGWMGLTEGTAQKLAMTGIMLSAPAFLLLGVVRVAAFYYQSTGNIGKSSWLIYGDSFIALPLCVYILPCFWGMNGVWLAMPISRILLLILLLYFWFGIKRK